MKKYRGSLASSLGDQRFLARAFISPSRRRPKDARQSSSLFERARKASGTQGRNIPYIGLECCGKKKIMNRIRSGLGSSKDSVYSRYSGRDN